MKIILDCDGVLADFMGHCCHLIGEGTPDTLYSIWSTPDSEHVKKIRKIFASSKECENIPWYPGAILFFYNLCENHDVTVVTKPFGTSNWREQRRRWLKKVVPNVKVEFSADKTVYGGDIIIEDDFGNVCSWVTKYKKPGILMLRPWNRGLYSPLPVVCCSDYEEITNYLEGL